MSIYNQKGATEAMNSYGTKGQPFVFLIDFEMKKILISTDLENDKTFRFQFNSRTNHQPIKEASRPSYFETFPISKSIYSTAFSRIKSEIQRGNSFLLNLTFPTKIVTDISLEDIYEGTSAKYKVWLKDNFVCFSPEIFIQINQGRIASFPMKGTIDANQLHAEKAILKNKKEVAEHYTIVDLIRNDLSMVAKNVKVDRFRYLDKIKTSNKDLLQVSSEVSGQLPVDYTSKIGDILFRLLPAGSISGAPKAKTIEIIRDAEGQERGYYTGICGIFDGKNLDSGVMIRYVEKVGDELYYRSGCGITSMSQVDQEYQEMLDKVYLPIKPTIELSECNAQSS